MTLEQINELKIEDCELILKQRLENEDATQEELESEFSAYKLELIAEETARIEELNRQADLQARWKVIHLRDAGVPAFRRLKSDVPNAEKYIQDLIKDKSRAQEAESFMEDIEAEDAILVHEIESNEYQELRKAEYGSLADQLDEIFHNIDAWKARIQAIKDKYPKS